MKKNPEETDLDKKYNKVGTMRHSLTLFVFISSFIGSILFSGTYVKAEEATVLKTPVSSTSTASVTVPKTLVKGEASLASCGNPPAPNGGCQASLWV